jgi:DNA-binding transcriptional ArsR family regulator
MDSGAIAQVISDGLARNHSPAQIAEEIVALIEDPAWAKAMSHPTRAAIVRLLRRHGQLSPVQVTRELDGQQLALVAYHFRRLEKLGLIEVCQRITQRGTIEHIYRLK